MRRLPPHGKEKCGSPRVTLRLHQLKEKKKDKLISISADHRDSYNCRGMDAVNKNGSGDGDDGSGVKEAGNNCDENNTGGSTGEQKENNAISGTTSATSNNAPAGDTDHHSHGNDRLDTSSTTGAPVKRTHSTDDDDDSKKKRRKDEGSRGKTGSNSGGSPKSLIGVESEGEEVKSVESPGPKVPPLKIVIAVASLEEPGAGGRNGKNGSGRHHLPYVVSTTSNTSTNSSGSGTTVSSSNNNNNNNINNNNNNNNNNNSSNNNTNNNNTNNNSNNNNNSSAATSAEAGNSNVGTSGVEPQSGTTEEPVGPKSPADEPVTSPSGGTVTTGRGHQRVLRSHRITKVTDVCRSSGGAGKEDRAGSGGSNNGGSGHSSPAGITATEGGSPRGLEGASPSPGLDTGNGSGNSVSESNTIDDKGNNAASPNSSSANNTANSEPRVSIGPTTTSDEPATTTASSTVPTSGQVQSTAVVQQASSAISSHQPELHPRKRKMRPKENVNTTNTNNSVVSSLGNGSTSPATSTTTTTAAVLSTTGGQASPTSTISSSMANGGTGITQTASSPNGNGQISGQTETNNNIETAGPSSTLQHLDQTVTNSYQLFLNIRKQIERKRKGLFPVQPKPPQGFKDYLMNRCTYVLASNATNRVPPPNTNPPANLHQGIKDLYIAQEKERHRLLMQHVIEKEKLVLSVEQEILRVHGRAARALANQALPFSACTILRDEEVYSAISPEQEEKDRNQARSRYNGRLFLSWLQDVDDKWEKIKESMLVRHHNEAESLHAVQKMDWEWKMKELGICEFKSNPVIEDSHVPMVHVSDDFDLLPA